MWIPTVWNFCSPGSFSFIFFSNHLQSIQLFVVLFVCLSSCCFCSKSCSCKVICVTNSKSDFYSIWSLVSLWYNRRSWQELNSEQRAEAVCPFKETRDHWVCIIFLCHHRLMFIIILCFKFDLHLSVFTFLSRGKRCIRRIFGCWSCMILWLFLRIAKAFGIWMVFIGMLFHLYMPFYFVWCHSNTLWHLVVAASGGAFNHVY